MKHSLWAIAELPGRVPQGDPQASWGYADEHPLTVTLGRDKLAQLNISGTLTKYGSHYSQSTKALRGAIQMLASEPSVQGLLLVLDSPGGQVHGLEDLANDVASLAKHKPVVAYCEDCCCSAAYWIAAQATQVFSNPSAVVGSIGSYSVLVDDSEFLSKHGIKLHVVRSAANKGLGADGTIPQELLEAAQKSVDQTHAVFVQAICRGRGLTPESAGAWATGDWFEAETALQLGLINGIKSYDEARKALQKLTAARATTLLEPRLATADDVAVAADTKPDVASAEGKIMPSESVDIKSLRAACPQASDSFLLKQLENGASLQEAQVAYISEQASTLEKLRAELEQLTAANVALEASVTALKENVTALTPKGSAPLTSKSASTPNSATKTFLTLVSELMEKSGMTRADAAAKVIASNPQLQKQMIAEANAGRTQRYPAVDVSDEEAFESEV